MRLLIVGSNGLLGSNVTIASDRRNWPASGTYHSTDPGFDVPLSRFDLREHDRFGQLLEEHHPDVVVNCAAMTDVDGCENDPGAAHEINGDAPGTMAEQCADHGTDFVHVSTDYVFDGTERARYQESADPNPIQVYGESKLAGERAVERAPGVTLIVRLSFVWGVHRATGELTGFPSWALGRLRSGDDVPLFTDQWVTPTRAGQAAETILDLIDHDATGTFHVACNSCVTPYEFGERLAEHTGHDDELLMRGSTDDVDRDAARPTFSCLSVNNVEDAVGRPQPTLREDIEAVADAT